MFANTSMKKIEKKMDQVSLLTVLSVSYGRVLLIVSEVVLYV